MGDLAAFDYMAVCERLRTDQEEHARQQEYKGSSTAVAPEIIPVTRRKAEWLSAWGVPTRMRDNVIPQEMVDENGEYVVDENGEQRMAGLVNTKALGAISDFMKCGKEAWCLVLSADKGAGKSTAAAYWLSVLAGKKAEMPDKPPTYWHTGPGLARVNSYGEEWERLIKVQNMVIDDLGIEYMDRNGNLLTRLDELLYTRHNEYLKTVITTNLNGGDFRRRYGERISDRIREGIPHGGGLIEIDDKSMRYG